MARAIGTEIKAAARVAATWGTAAECKPGQGLLIRPSGFSKSQPNLIDDSLGTFWASDSDVGEITAAGEINAYLRYSGLELLLAAAMGTHGVSYGGTPDSGTAESATSTTITDTDKAWTPDEHIGAFVQLTGGTGSGQVRKISDNDSDTLTVDEAWATTPDATTTYEISEVFPLGVNTHTLELADDLDDLFITAAFYNNVDVDELATAKVSGFTISGAVGGAIEVAFNLIAIDRSSGSVVNTTVTMPLATVREPANRVLYNQGAILMNAASGGALSNPTDIIYPSNFTLTFSRTMRGVYGLGGTFDKIDEPSNDGKPSVSMTMEFPRYTASTHFDNLEAGTPQKCQLLFTGGLISGSDYRTFKIELPNMKYAAVDLPIVEGIMAQPIEFNCLSRASAPTGMTVTNPFEIEIVNNYGGAPLLAGN